MEVGLDFYSSDLYSPDCFHSSASIARLLLLRLFPQLRLLHLAVLPRFGLLQLALLQPSLAAGPFPPRAAVPTPPGAPTSG